MDERALLEHEVELEVDLRPRLSDCGRRCQHGAAARHPSQIAALHDRRRHVVDPNLEAARRPVDELDSPLHLNFGDRRVHVLRNDIASVQHAARHVLAAAAVTLHHLVVVVEQLRRQVVDGDLLVERFCGRNERSEGSEREVDPRVRHEVRLELVHVNVERSVEPQRGCDARHDLRDQLVEVDVARAFDVQPEKEKYLKFDETRAGSDSLGLADVVDRLIVEDEGAVDVVHRVVRRQH